MLTSRKDMRTEREKYLESELEQHRAREERESEQREREREKRARERREAYAYEMRQAENWPEALHKNKVLFQNEARDDDEEVDKFFENSARACESALALWSEIEKEKQPEIAELEKRIADIRDSVRLEVATRLEAQDGCHEFALVAEEIRGDDIASFLYW